jgi:hypothetical protein
MQGIYYLLSIVALFIVFVWYIRNDDLAEGEPTHGLLAMKETSDEQLTDGAANANSSSASGGGATAATRNQTRSFLRQGRRRGKH